MHNGRIVANGRPEEMLEPEDEGDLEMAFVRWTNERARPTGATEEEGRVSQWWSRITGVGGEE